MEAQKFKLVRIKIPLFSWETCCTFLAYGFEKVCVRWYTYTCDLPLVFCVSATQLATSSQQLLQLLFFFQDTEYPGFGYIMGLWDS